MQSVRLYFLHHFRPGADGAFMPDLLPLPAAPLTLHLHLLEDPRRELVFLNHRPPALALAAGIHHPVRGPAPLALLAHLLFLNGEIMACARVEVAKWDRHSGFHVWASALALRVVAEVAGSAEEAGEEVEGVVAALSASAALFVLREAVVAVLVVDLAGFGLREGVVGFGDGDEFLGGGFIAPRVEKKGAV